MKIFAKIEFSVCPNSQISNSSIAELNGFTYILESE